MNLEFITQILGTLQPKKQAPVPFGMTPPFVEPPTGIDDPRAQLAAPTIPPIAPPAIPDRDPSRFTGLNTGQQFGLGPQAEPQPVVPAIPAPSASAGIPAPTVPVVAPRTRTPLEEDFAEITGKRYNKGVYRNPETGETTNNPRKPGFTEVVTEPGKDRDKKWSLGEKIAGGLIGWAKGGLAGGIAGATDRNFFEKQGDQQQLKRIVPALQAEQQIEAKNADIYAKQERPAIARAELRRKIAADKRRFDNQTAALEAKGKAESDKWKPYVDEQGRRWKQFLNDPGREMEPIIDPTTREQDIDPMQKMYEWTDPTSGQTVPLKGSQLATVGATIAAGNAQREQDASKFNSSQQVEVAKTNAANRFNYSKALFDRISEIAKTSGEAKGSYENSIGLFNQAQEALQTLQSLDPTVDEKAYLAAQTKYNDLREKFHAAAAKTSAGEEAVRQLQSQGLTPPETVDYKPIKASKVVVPKSKDPLGLFR